MKYIQDCFTTQRFQHLPVMMGRHITIRKCILLLIYALILVCVFILGDKYGRSGYEAQQNTVKLYGSEEIYFKSIQSKLNVDKISKTGEIRTQRITSESNRPSIQILETNAVTKNRLHTLSSDGRLIPVLSSDGRRIPELSSDGRLIPVLSSDGRRIPVLSSDGRLIPVLSSDGRRIPELSSDGRRISELSSNERRIPVLSSDGRRINPAENKPVTTKPPILSYEEIQRLSYKEVEGILDRVQNWFRIQNEAEKDPLLNRHQFTFYLNSRLCVNNVDILIFVISASQNIKRREEIRKTWGSVKQYKNVSIVTVFMLGESNNSLVNQNLTVESVKYGDTVQGNFLDSYRNLTYKHVMALHWVTSQCNDVRTIVKVDDDVLINTYKLINFSISMGHVHNKLYCSIFFHFPPIRDVTDKYYTPHELYPFEVYPTYCEGLAYILSVDEVTKLYKASEDTRFYWVEDVYVTGILARKAGIGHLRFGPNHQYMEKNGISNIAFKDNMFYLDYDDWSGIWDRIHTERNIYR